MMNLVQNAKVRGWMILDVLLLLFLLILFLTALNINQTALSRRAKVMQDDAKILQKAAYAMEAVRQHHVISEPDITVKIVPYMFDLESVEIQVKRPDNKDPYVLKSLRKIQN